MKKTTVMPIVISIFLLSEMIFPSIKKLFLIENAILIALAITLICSISFNRPKMVIGVQLITIFGLLCLLFINRAQLLLPMFDMKNLINPISYLIFASSLVLIMPKKNNLKTIHKKFINWNGILITTISILVIIIMLNNYSILDFGLLYINTWKIFFIMSVNLILYILLNVKYGIQSEKYENETETDPQNPAEEIEN